MLPILRSVVAGGGRSLSTEFRRRNYSSGPGIRSNGAEARATVISWWKAGGLALALGYGTGALAFGDPARRVDEIWQKSLRHHKEMMEERRNSRADSVSGQKS